MTRDTLDGVTMRCEGLHTCAHTRISTRLLFFPSVSSHTRQMTMCTPALLSPECFHSHGGFPGPPWVSLREGALTHIQLVPRHGDDESGIRAPPVGCSQGLAGVSSLGVLTRGGGWLWRQLLHRPTPSTLHAAGHYHHLSHGPVPVPLGEPCCQESLTVCIPAGSHCFNKVGGGHSKCLVGGQFLSHPS